MSNGAHFFGGFMQSLKLSLCLLFAALIGLASVNASVATTVLLDEEGNPRCKIEGEHGDYLSAERFAEFVENDPAAAALDEINALRECGDQDVAYAGILLAPQEIQAAAITPTAHRIITAGFMGFHSILQCASGVRHSKEHGSWFSRASDPVAYGAFWAGLQSTFLKPFDPTKIPGVADKFLVIS